MPKSNTLRNVKPYRNAGCAALVIAVMVAPLFAGPAAPRTQREGREPPMLFTLKYDNREVPVAMDKPFEVTIAGKTHKMSLSAKPYREFDAAGVRFRYPTSHAFEFDNSTEGMISWTLDGGDNTITVMRYEDTEADASLPEIVDGLTQAFGQDNVTKTDTSIQLAGKTYRGKKLVIRVQSLSITQEVFAIPQGKSAILLTIQDSPQDDGSPSAETKAVKVMLQETFTMRK